MRRPFRLTSHGQEVVTQPTPDPSPPSSLLRLLPQVERALHWPQVTQLVQGSRREDVVEALRWILEGLRGEILEGRVAEEDLRARIAPDCLAQEIRQALAARQISGYRRVINATGIILHTGLGRAVLPPLAVEALSRACAGYSLVEVDPETGERNLRETSVVRLLCDLTGAESGTVVNNNAAATLLILAALARGKEVVISRGQLVEIGGSFRIPEILRESGARLVEVGTTNRTYAEDYGRAVGPETGLILQVHTSNYEIRGFVHHTPLEELVALGRRHGIPVVSDLGSGCFVDLSPCGFRPEPLARDRIRAGADLVCFSGDKVLGGPQAGIILGRSELIGKVRAHPLFRAVRIDKVTLVLLEATLRIYRHDPEHVHAMIPVLRAITEPSGSVRRRAEDCVAAVAGKAPGLEAIVLATGAQAGSGALPAQEIPSFAVAVSHAALPPQELAKRLRTGSPAIFPRIQGGQVLLDMRTVLPGEEVQIAEALERLAAAV